MGKSLNSNKPLDVNNQDLQKETGVKGVKSMDNAFANSMSMPSIEVNINRTGVEGSISPISDKPQRQIRTPEQEAQEASSNFAQKQAKDRLIT